MAAQLVFDTPRNREIFNRYRMALHGNPEWEPEGKLKYKRGGGIDTVNIDGVEYYKNTSYGNPGYLHRNEKKIPFKIAGKKSAAVSGFLDSAIPIATKYATAAAALGLPIAAGNPELVPASLLVQSDVHPILAKKLRKLIKEKTGYGVYNQMEGMGDSLALRDIKINKKLEALIAAGPSKYQSELEYKKRKKALREKLNDLGKISADKYVKSQEKWETNYEGRVKKAIEKAEKDFAALQSNKQPRKKRTVKPKITEKETSDELKVVEKLYPTKKTAAKKSVAKKTAAKKQEFIPASITINSPDNPLIAAVLQDMMSKGPIGKPAHALRMSKKLPVKTEESLEGMGDSLAMRRLKTARKYKALKEAGPGKYKIAGDFEARKFKLKNKLRILEDAQVTKADQSLADYKAKLKKFKKQVNEEEAVAKYMSKLGDREVKALKKAERKLKSKDWINEVKAYQKTHNVTYKEALKKASEARKNKM